MVKSTFLLNLQCIVVKAMLIRLNFMVLEAASVVLSPGPLIVLLKLGEVHDRPARLCSSSSFLFYFSIYSNNFKIDIL